jgi:hypothetical protein
MTDQITLSDNQYAYDVAGGTMYVTILAATEKDYHSTGKGRVVELRGRLMIRTSPSKGWDLADNDYVKIRGRQYSAWNYVERVPEYQSWDGQTIRWQNQSSPYNGGYRSEQGELDWKAKTRDVLQDMEREVLDRFEAEHPEWHRVSERMHLEGELGQWQRKADEARAEAAKHDAQAARVAEQLKSYA